MPVFYDGNGMGWLGMFFAMLIPLAFLGFIICFGLNSGLKGQNEEDSELLR